MHVTTDTPLDRWFGGRLPASGAIEPAGLLALAEELAARPDLWGDHVRHDERRRVYTRIHRDPVLDVWLICWSGTQDTGLHDHDLSSGAVRVVRGSVAEERLALGQPELTVTEYPAGGGFRFDASRIHNVRHAGADAATSLHLYSPPLWRMGYYEVSEDGSLARRSATYVEELGAGR
jgi:predicted metal-dependent enzyme (double-stranded beta helix superfamily)